MFDVRIAIAERQQGKMEVGNYTCSRSSMDRTSVFGTDHARSIRAGSTKLVGSFERIVYSGTHNTNGEFLCQTTPHQSTHYSSKDAAADQDVKIAPTILYTKQGLILATKDSSPTRVHIQPPLERCMTRASLPGHSLHNLRDIISIQGLVAQLVRAFDS
jgi:hypothetical protein